MAPVSPVILIVEDEFLLRMDSAEMIETAGFEFVQAGNADEAIAILQVRPAIHIVFTDIQMPAQWTVSSSAGSSGTAGRRSKSSRRPDL
jgi:CheY-like chemotaxis protein